MSKHIVTTSSGGQAYEVMATGGVHAGQSSTVYRRLWNTTVARFESAMAQLETQRMSQTGKAVPEYQGVAFATGMATISAVFLSRVKAGKNHVVAVRPLYGGTDHLLASELFGASVSFVAADQIAAAITPQTGLVVVETPANPTLQLLDLSDIVSQAGEVPVMVDNTFATPVLQQPLEFGVSFVVHSATKYIGGHGDAMGGVVVTTQKYAVELRQVRAITGALLDPQSAYLLHRGLPTLSIRVLAAQKTASELANWFLTQSKIADVYYPGLPGGDIKGLIGKQMQGPGAMIAINMNGGFAAAQTLCKNLSMITHAVSLGSTDTLIQHPAGLTHRPVASQAKPGPGILRISVGLESAADLIADFTAALSYIS
jgi:methionine-gamma-lyase